MTPQTLADTAWMAGILEGEGCIHLRPDRPDSVTITVSMTDEDVVRRLHEMTGLGRLRGPYAPRSGGSKFFWTWVVASKQEAADLLWRTHEFFGTRRAAKAAEAMERLAQPFLRRTRERGAA